MQNTTILPTAYFGNIKYYSTLLKYKNIIIEAHEHYVKQTFRNRCVIATANGPLILTIPVHYSNTLKTKTKDVTVDYSKNWQKQHFKAIESAYRKSPFYEFFIDDFMFVFEKKEKFLLDLNMKILLNTLELLQTHVHIKRTSKYLEDSTSPSLFEKLNFENHLNLKPYSQIFSERFGFIENLSLMDLLFNIGMDFKKYCIT